MLKQLLLDEQIEELTMEIYFKDHLTNIFNKLNVAFNYKDDKNVFFIVITKDNISNTLAVWHRSSINNIIFYCPVQNELSMEDCKRISLELMNENEDILYGNLAITDSVDKGNYMVSFQYSFVYERGQGFLVTEEEIKDFLSYAAYFLPKIRERLSNLLSKEVDV